MRRPPKIDPVLVDLLNSPPLPVEVFSAIHEAFRALNRPGRFSLVDFLRAYAIEKGRATQLIGKPIFGKLGGIENKK